MRSGDRLPFERVAGGRTNLLREVGVQERQTGSGGREGPRATQAMELEVNSEAVDAGVETVEVVAAGEDNGCAALMEQQIMVGNPQELIVPTSDVSGSLVGARAWGSEMGGSPSLPRFAWRKVGGSG